MNRDELEALHLRHPPSVEETLAFVAYWQHCCLAAFAAGLALGTGIAYLALSLAG